MDPAGLAIGVVPLIVLTFAAYRRVADLRDQYSRLDKHLARLLKEIYADQCLFQAAVDVLLKLCGIPDAVRVEMMTNLHCDQWEEKSFSSRLHAELGDVLPAVVYAIESAKDTIAQIEDKLSELSSNTTNTKNGSTDPAKVSGAFSKRFSLRRLRRAEKFKCLLNDTTQQLKILQTDLRRSSKRVKSVIFLRNQAPPRPQDNTIAQPIGTVSYYDILNAVARQKASKKLHSIVSRALRLTCQCHLLHICLGDLETAMTEPAVSQLTGAPQFCFLLSSTSDSACPHGLPPTQTRIPYFVFTVSNENISAGSLSENLECIIKKLQASDQPFEHLFCDPSSGGNGSTAFILRPPLALKYEHMATQKSVISLDKLISSHGPTRLECLQISKRLVETALSFYASPWISKWTLETVECFDKTANDRREFFGTHIAVTFSDAQATNRDNREIRALGLMLLRLGLKKSLQNLSEDDPQELPTEELYDLFEEMGKDFTGVVRDLITWGASNVDLMETDNLVVFLSKIKMLKKLVGYHTPGYEHPE